MKLREVLSFSIVVFALVANPFSGVANADVFNLEGPIDGTQAGTGQAGTGFVTATYDDVSNLFSWDINYSGLTTFASGMHFHNAAAGSTGPLVVDVAPISGLTSPSAGSTTISAFDGAELLADRVYLDIHTNNFPNREIRGQLLLSAIPEPASSVLIGMFGLGLFFKRRRRKM